MASSLCKCLLRVCFADEASPDDDDSSRDDEVESYEPLRSNRMSRLFQSTDPLYSVAAQVEEPIDENDDQDDHDDQDDDPEDNCCQSTNDNDNTTSTSTTTGTMASSATATTMDNNPHATGLKQFWRRLTERFNLENPAASEGATTTTTRRSSSGGGRGRGCFSDESVEGRRQQQERDERMPILKQASSFDSSKEIPTIQTEQIVLPGSELQQQMAKAMACKLAEQDDECVICMDGFTPSNPRMPTLCGCGENNTYFHLPCLYQWIEQDRNCPSCRKRLRWEEF